MAQSFEVTKTSWLRVAVLIGAGAAVAMQIGKVPAALPALQAELGLTLTQSGWVVAIFSLIAAAFAVFLGSLSDRFGPLQIAITGMILTAVSGIAGGFVDSGTGLLLTRIFEGLGFILTSTSMPPLIVLAVTARHRKTSFALWGMYMPLGSGIMMALSGPLLYFFDWRVLWWVTSLLILSVAIPVFLVGKRLPGAKPSPSSRMKLRDILRYSRRPGPILLAITFAFYAGQYLIVAGFLPLVLIELNGYSAVTAAAASAFVVFFNALGNAVSGWLHSRNFKTLGLILTGSLVMSLASIFIFAAGVPGAYRIAAGVAFAGFAGLIPSSLFAEIPKHAPRQSVMATISGMLVQGAAIGQLAGPPIAAAVVALSGNWQAAIPVMLAAGGITAISAIALARSQPAQPETGGP